MVKGSTNNRNPHRRAKMASTDEHPITNFPHYRFIKSVVKDNVKSKFSIQTHLRPIMPIVNSKVENGNFVGLFRVTDKYITPTLKIHPEFIAFIFYLEGCPKNLLLFLIAFELDHKSGKYDFNVKVRTHFRSFSKEIFSVEYTDSTVIQAHRELVAKNLVCNVKNGQYFLNPLAAGGSNSSGRRLLISEYTQLLLKKGKDEVMDFYPMYK